MEVEWLPFELRPAPAALPWRRCPGRAASTSAIAGATDGATASTSSPKLAQNHGAEIHVPPTSPAPRSPRPSTPSPKNGDAAGSTARRRTTPSLSRGRTWGMRGFAWGGKGGGPRGRGGGDRVGPGPDLRPRSVCEEALGTGVHAVPTIATREEVL